MSTAELHTLTGAYALHALPEDERISFERHLTDCPSCAQEVRELASTAARLGRAMAQTPPERMKGEVLRRIATERQDPPATVRAGRVRGRFGRSATRFALAACLVAAAGFGGVAVWQHQVARDADQRAAEQASAAQQRAEQLAAVLAAPDAKVTTGKVADGANATVVLSRRLNRAAFVASGLPQPPAGKVYQLWFNDGGTMRAAGLLNPAARADSVLMDGQVGTASGMGITVEPAGGSPAPTTDPVALMEFPA
ncbi:anti-sigma factor domain-containing protein [Streptomyces sp. NPDC004111]|uniref:anti-sigma factor n=1 Tax=Streptomyces sp. NPDC004111 TaxID=3364690 RepID=UPI003695854F